MPKAVAKPVGYREDIARVVSRIVGKMPGVREKKGVSGRPQFFAGERLFAFVASDGVALKLPADVVQQVIDQADYLPFKMRNKPVLREWIRIKHTDASAYTKDAALFRQGARFVAASRERPRAVLRP
jgi:hypothetical protein